MKSGITGMPLLHGHSGNHVSKQARVRSTGEGAKTHALDVLGVRNFTDGVTQERAQLLEAGDGIFPSKNHHENTMILTFFYHS